VSGGARTVKVPVRMLEHYHFRLRKPDQREVSARAMPSPATCLRNPPKEKERTRGPAGVMRRHRLRLEFKVDDIVDWLWEESSSPT